MVSDSEREYLSHIIISCEDLRELAMEVRQPLIAHLLEMVIVQARRARAGDGAIDGEV